MHFPMYITRILVWKLVAQTEIKVHWLNPKMAVKGNESEGKCVKWNYLLSLWCFINLPTTILSKWFFSLQLMKTFGRLIFWSFNIKFEFLFLRTCTHHIVKATKHGNQQGFNRSINLLIKNDQQRVFFGNTLILSDSLGVKVPLSIALFKNQFECDYCIQGNLCQRFIFVPFD